MSRRARTGPPARAGSGRLRPDPGARAGWPLVAYIVGGYPDAETSLRIALAAIDAGADLLEVGLPYSDPLADGATLQRATQVALRQGPRLRPRSHLLGRIQPPARRCRWWRWATSTRSSAAVTGGGGPGASVRPVRAGVIVADLTPDEGAPFETVAADGRAGSRLPGGADHRRHAGPWSPRAPGLPLLRLAGRRDRRPDRPAGIGRRIGSCGQGGLAGAGRRRLRCQPAGPRRRSAGPARTE